MNLPESAPVAQLDRASDFESAGRPFESGRARQIFQQLTSENRRVVPNWGANCAGFVRVPLVAGGIDRRDINGLPLVPGKLSEPCGPLRQTKQHLGCQGRRKTRPGGGAKLDHSRVGARVWFVGSAGVAGAETCSDWKAARLGRSERHPCRRGDMRGWGMGGFVIGWQRVVPEVLEDRPREGVGPTLAHNHHLTPHRHPVFRAESIRDYTELGDSLHSQSRAETEPVVAPM